MPANAQELKHANLKGRYISPRVGKSDPSTVVSVETSVGSGSSGHKTSGVNHCTTEGSAARSRKYQLVS